MVRLLPATLLAALGGLVPTLGAAQVVIHPPALAPAAWERVELRVFNQTDSAWVEVRLEVPDAVGVLGVGAPPGWSGDAVEATATTPQAITWAGGRVEPGGFTTFTFLARLAADVRQRDLFFPVRLTSEGGRTVDWRRGGEAPALRVGIAGTTQVSPWAPFALAGAAFGLAVLAVVLAARRRTAAQ